MIIVTGGAGFIGSNLVYALNNRGIEDILVVDRLNSPLQHKNLNDLRFADYIDQDQFIENLDLFRSAKAIFHQGACSSTTESDSVYMMKNNYDYSKNLLEFSLRAKIPFLYASSASVYGNGDNGFSEERKAEYPLNVYAFSKALFDRYVMQLASKPDSQVLGLRYFNVYGPQENHKNSMASVAQHLYHQLSNNNKMSLFKGSQSFRRDFIHVDDVVKVNLFFLDNCISGIFNCGTGNARSFLDVAMILRSLWGQGEIEYIPFPKELSGKYQSFTEANILALREVGFKDNFLTLEDGLEKYYSNLVNSEGYIRD